MDSPHKFRSALNGFHRDDVVRYLEYLNTKHQTTVNQLQGELEALRAQAEAAPERETELYDQCQALQTDLEAAEAQRRDLEEENGALTAENEGLKAQCEALKAQCEALKARIEALEQRPAAPETLENYRQAENVVRQSRTRAELVYYQTNGVLTAASAKVDTAAQDITALTDKTMEELTRLQMAVASAKHALQDAAAMMKSIRPNE